MKKTILTLAVTVFIAGAMLTGCNSSEQKEENAREKVADAKQDLNQASKESILQFKKEAEEKLSHFEKGIAEFKAGLANQKKEIRARYEKKLTEFEQRNSDMKKKLENLKDDGKDQWEKFKAEFNQDMEELGTAFKDLTVKNVK